jgi:hypothetical protein
MVRDSGNGWHLLYSIELPNSPESTELVRALLGGCISCCRWWMRANSNASRLCKFWALGAWECTLTKDLAGVRASGMKDVAGLSQSKSSMHGRTRRSTGTRSDTAWQPTSIDGSRRQSGSGASEVRKLTHHHGPLHEGRVRRQAPVHWKTNGHVVGWEELPRVASVPWAIWLFSGDGP